MATGHHDRSEGSTMTRLRRLAYVAWKYGRMNPFRLWWLRHVIDEWRTPHP